jgi:hypothetical protein
MVVPPKRPSKQEFRQAREDALDLMQWALDDISPDAKHRLTLKMGIEREGHFIDKEGKSLSPANRGTWSARRHQSMDEMAEKLFGAVRGDADVERVYHDKDGTFMIEVTTKPISPKASAAATERLSAAILGEAEKIGIAPEDMRFGTLRADFIRKVRDSAKLAFYSYEREVFEAPPDPPGGLPSLMLPRCAQHANVSLWCGKENMFAHDAFYSAGHSTTRIGTLSVREAVKTLPGMMLPARKDSYLHIAAGAQGSVQHIGIALGVKKTFALNWVAKDDKPELTRLEFRQGAAEADPLDIALAAAVPVTKSVLKHVQLNASGKAQIGEDGLVKFAAPPLGRSETTPMPKSQEEAAKMFNTADNPNFTFLNELAERKIARMAVIDAQQHSAGSKHNLREAEKLRGLGTRLHGMYCREYGLESVMQAVEPDVGQRRR